MLKLNPMRNKSLTFDIQLEGADKQQLDYNLRLKMENIEYDVKGALEENGKIKFTLPKISELTNKFTSGKPYKICFEATTKNFFLRPWEDEIILEKMVSLGAKLTNESVLEEEEGGIRMKTILEQQEEHFTEPSLQEDSFTTKSREEPSGDDIEGKLTGVNLPMWFKKR